MLISYHFLFPHLSHRFFRLSGQQRENYRCAQHYIYDIPPETNVILGSSMSQGLNDQTLGRDYFKLTLPGGSMLTGLEIIRRAGKHPRVVLIEVNALSKKVDWEFVHDLFSPILFGLRRYSPIFREEGRPSNFVNGIAEAAVRKPATLFAHASNASNGTQAALSDKTKQFLQLLSVHRQELSPLPSVEDLNARVEQLAIYADALAQSGSTCVFFEMPMDSSLATLPWPTGVRRAMETAFSRDRYHWLSFSRDHNYQTVDGVHLVRFEADRLTEEVVRQVNQIAHRKMQQPRVTPLGKKGPVARAPN